MAKGDGGLVRSALSMGVATGGDAGGVSPPVRNSGGMSPQKSRFLKKILCIFLKIFRFSNVFQIKWPKSEEKSEFGGRWFSFT